MIHGGRVGLIIDARGRPLELPADDPPRLALLQEWLEASQAYTLEELAALQPPPPLEEAPADVAEDQPVEPEADYSFCCGWHTRHQFVSGLACCCFLNKGLAKRSSR